MQDYIEVKSNGKIIAKMGTNPRSPYNHQKDAMAKLSLIDKEESFSTLVVLPTGERDIIVTSRKNTVKSRVLAA